MSIHHRRKIMQTTNIRTKSTLKKKKLTNEKPKFWKIKTITKQITIYGGKKSNQKKFNLFSTPILTIRSTHLLHS